MSICYFDSKIGLFCYFKCIRVAHLTTVFGDMHTLFVSFNWVGLQLKLVVELLYIVEQMSVDITFCLAFFYLFQCLRMLHFRNAGFSMS